MIELTPDEHKILVDAIQDSATVVHKGRKDMNERIQKLAEQADGVFIHKLMTGAKQYTFLEKDLAKFAELIVRECANVANQHMEHNEGTDYNVGGKIKQYFGVEL